ncbi:MAG: DegT/DnrJ/EryC1/StrS family aminotransferase [Anaerolineaceae bacterium]|nr:DegT/DnrJ/EryC1/StrS family aminotransferase [Anaerolineaceae bacterium]
MSWIVPLSDIAFGPEEKTAVMDVLDRGWLTMGSVTAQFETEFAAYASVKHAFAVTNCTAALHMACQGLGLQPGDEVIIPSLTFVATANAVRYTGATPVFADISCENDLTISPDAIRRAITPRSKAVMLMHYAGYPCDLPRILQLAKDHHLLVIEDAAHAAGSRLDGKMLGTWGQAGCYSFFSNKNMTTGEGGMVVTDSDELAEKFRVLRSHGMTSLTWDRHQGHAWSYDVVALGYNYRIDEIRSALGCAQLAKLETFNARRRQLTALYRQLLSELAPSVTVPFQNHPGQSTYHIMPIVLPPGINRIRFMECMKSQGIQTSIHYPPIHTFKAFTSLGRPRPNLPVTNIVGAREVTLPLYPRLTDEQIHQVVQAVQSSLN